MPCEVIPDKLKKLVTYAKRPSCLSIPFGGDSDGFVKSEFDVPESLVEPTQELIRGIVEWRLAEYFERPTQNAPRQFTLKVSHAADNPMLFLPDRTTHPELPEGWADVRINDEVLCANFVKIALNVLRRSNSSENELPGILKAWFGDDAGKSGTRHQVILSRQHDEWSLSPSGTDVIGVQPYRRYRRDAIPSLSGLPTSERAWGQGFVRQGNHVFLFVTLDKTGHDEAFQYKDHFI